EHLAQPLILHLDRALDERRGDRDLVLLDQLAQRTLARLAVDRLALAVLELLAERPAQAVERVGLAGVLGELVVERRHVLGSRLAGSRGPLRPPSPRCSACGARSRGPCSLAARLRRGPR